MGGDLLWAGGASGAIRGMPVWPEDGGGKRGGIGAPENPKGRGEGDGDRLASAVSSCMSTPEK